MEERRKPLLPSGKNPRGDRLDEGVLNYARLSFMEKEAGLLLLVVAQAF